MKTAILASSHYFEQRMESPGSLWFDMDEVIETEDKYKHWLDLVIPLFETNKITRIFGLTDLTALIAAHCEYLLGIRSHESFLKIAKCLNKPYVRSLIGDKEYNVKTVYTFPAFVKPVHSSLSQGSGYVKTEDEFQTHIEQHSESVYKTTEKYRVFGKVAGLDFTDTFHTFYGEECIDSGIQLTADVLSHNGKIDVISVSESVFHEEIPSFSYFDFPYGCHGYEMKMIKDSATEIAEILGLENLLFNIEFIWTHDRKLKLIEVNPRPATQFLPAIKAVYGFDGWSYLESGVPLWVESVTSNMAIKIFRTKIDSEIIYIPGEGITAKVKAEMGVHYNSFAIKGTKLSDSQQDGYTYRVGEAYIPYADGSMKFPAFKETLNILESEFPLLQDGEII